MIGLLRGTILDKQPPELLLDVQGVGYELELPLSSFFELPETGEQVQLHTHLVVRDDAHVLYGFASTLERSLFRALIRISGVGPKLALGLLSGMRPEEFVACVEQGDSATLTRLPGIGKKTAERLLIEMRDRARDLISTSAGGLPAAGGPGKAAPANAANDPVSDAVSALIALGYKPAEAGRLARDVAEDAHSSEQIIRLALQKALKR
ncbi:Holliday junction branch migration protein RuvA [Alkalilimnicola sp. S0819]|uniref:Holliday junction branch migration protein RuvA n=1 Tax=Alkalilimnicola sp. S0819 TaxID=2613922 RepID=UPI001261DB2D|nr:Holliday junction branch migration protein RuvA [Alkalilimnicola sp. S0819]KAB7628290.1 Holliday junction branch migration protein RuvA [Alkalilimnicola sp. S0819]MPQ15187.1 Holliday junction branch migration protein RuvA [Alkalilimnicola sp. S0819]